VPRLPFEPSPRAILFDLDDTLCDYAAARRERLRVAFTLSRDQTRRVQNPEDLDRLIDESIRVQPHGAEHFADLFRNHSLGGAAEAAAAAHWFRTNRFHGLRLFPEVADVLGFVKWLTLPSGECIERKLGIVTNGPTEVQRAKVDLLALQNLVDFVVISEEFGAAKPDPEIFHEALRRARTSAAETVFVGDSPEFDIAGARAAGLHTVWVNRAGLPWPPDTPAPTHEIRTLNELSNLVAGTNSSAARQMRHTDSG
jgi:putative hydrolase of the HAD superfamily